MAFKQGLGSNLAVSFLVSSVVVFVYVPSTVCTITQFLTRPLGTSLVSKTIYFEASAFFAPIFNLSWFDCELAFVV